MPNHGSSPGAASKDSRAFARVLEGMGSPVGRQVSHRTRMFSPPRKGSCCRCGKEGSVIELLFLLSCWLMADFIVLIEKTDGDG